MKKKLMLHVCSRVQVVNTWNVAECKLRKLNFKSLWWMRASYRPWEASQGRAGLAPRANLVKPFAKINLKVMLRRRLKQFTKNAIFEYPKNQGT